MDRLGELIDRYIRAAGVAGMAIKRDGTIEALDVVGREIRAGDAVLCCLPPAHERIARAACARQRSTAGQQAAVEAVMAVAAEMHVSVIPHSVVLQRSYDAVHLIDRQVEDAQHQGALKAWTQEYKAARGDDPTLTYSRFTHSKKLALVVATAARMRS